MVKLICSAYRKDASNTENALATADLLLYLKVRSYNVQLVVGSYQATGEIAVEVTGFQNLSECYLQGRAILVWFRQASALIVDDEGCGNLVTRGGHNTRLGKMQYSTSAPPGDHTRYLNGTYLAPHQAAV